MTVFEVFYLAFSFLVGAVLPVYLLKKYPKHNQFWWSVLPVAPSVATAALLDKWYNIHFGLYLLTCLLVSVLCNVFIALLYRLIYKEKPQEPEQA